MPSITRARSTGKTNPANVLLWVAQTLLAALFLFAGAAKLAMPLAPVAQMTGLPVAFLRFIAVAEILGALGLILPGWLRTQPGLTPLAATGLVGIMTGATVLTAASQGVSPAIFPLVVGILLVTVVWGRREWTGQSAPVTSPACDVAPLAVAKRAA